MARSTILTHLTVDKDLSLNREPLKIGRVRYMRQCFKANYTKMLMLSLLLLLFAAPAIVLIVLYPSQASEATAHLNFSGNIGIGYPGSIDATAEGMAILYDLQFKLMAYLVPCIAFFGIGCAGAFYCARNVLWGVPLKLGKHFFRGIKLYWWQYFASFSVIAGVAYGVGVACIYNLKCVALGTANAGTWILMIFALIFALIFLMYMMFLLPMMMCYKFKLGALLKNSAIFTVSLFPTNILTVILMGVPFLALLISFLGIFVLFIMAFLGLAFYCLWINSYAQFAFDNFINELYAARNVQYAKKTSEEKQIQKKKTSKTANVSPVKSYKKKKK